MLIALQIVAAYALTDALGGLFHLVTDRGYNIKKIVHDFRNHHDKPHTMTFDLMPMFGGLPVLLAGLWFSSVFLIALGAFICFTQVPHYYTHFDAPLPIKVLQKLHIFLPPEKHSAHHNGVFDCNYCVTAGWSDWWINWIAKKTSPELKKSGS